MRLNAGLTVAQDDQENEAKVVASDDFTVFEGGLINWGWVDYRDHYLGPELKGFLEFQYGYQDIKTHLFGDQVSFTVQLFP